LTEASIGSGDTAEAAAIKSKIRELQQKNTALQSGGGEVGGPTYKGPQFLDPVPNITVAVGRDATLPCVVKSLHDYKV
jgi:hypothetical protein